MAILVRESRADKLVEIATADVRRQQEARLGLEAAAALTTLRQEALDAAQTPDRITLARAGPSLAYAEAHLFERDSVARDHELLTETLRHGRGQIALEDAKGELGLQETAGHLLRAGDEMATQASLDRERQMIATVNRGMGRFDRLGGDQAWVASDRLRLEQQQAVAVVLDSHDRAVNLRGAAGTGKTATLEELRRGLLEAGREVRAVAPTMSAVDVLHDVGFGEATTIQRLLTDPRAQADLRHTVLIVDEAGMVSGRQMTELLTLAERQDARIVFSGDTRQLQSVEAADALRILERESHLTSVSLTQVQRQTHQEYREAIQALRQDPAAGFAHLERMGAVREVAWQDRARTVAEAWRAANAPRNAQGQARSVLVVCATHEEIGQVTAAIRAERQQAGELGESVRVDRYVPAHYTTAQKRDPRNFTRARC